MACLVSYSCNSKTSEFGAVTMIEDSIITNKSPFLFLLLITMAVVSNAQAPELVLDINKTNKGADVSQIVNFKEEIYFKAWSADAGYELWKSDGSPQGTNLLLDIVPGSKSSFIRNLSKTSNALFFTSLNLEASDDKNAVYAFDGKDTTRITASRYRPKIWPLGERVMILSWQDNSRTVSLSDGTVDGTIKLSNAWYSIKGQPIHDEDGIYFIASTLDADSLFYVDIDNKLTFLLEGTNLNPELIRSSAGMFYTQGGSMFELQSGQLTYIGGAVQSPFWFNDTLYGFKRLSYANYTIVSVPQGSETYGEFESISTPAVFGEYAIFAATTHTEGEEIWSFEPNTGNLQQLTNLNPGFYSSFPVSLVQFNNRVYFIANSPLTGYQLWITNGSLEGTYLAGTQPDKGREFSMNFIGRNDNYLAMGLYKSDMGLELWYIDKTSPDPQLHADINPGPANGYLFSTLHAFVEDKFFTASLLKGSQGRQLWKIAFGQGKSTQLTSQKQPGTVDNRTQILGSSGNKLVLSTVLDGMIGTDIALYSIENSEITGVAGVRPGQAPKFFSVHDKLGYIVNYPTIYRVHFDTYKVDTLFADLYTDRPVYASDGNYFYVANYNYPMSDHILRFDHFKSIPDTLILPDFKPLYNLFSIQPFDDVLYIYTSSSNVFALQGNEFVEITEFGNILDLESDGDNMFISNNNTIWQYAADGFDTLYSSSDKIAFTALRGQVLKFSNNSGSYFVYDITNKNIIETEIPGYSRPASTRQGDTLFLASGNDFWALDLVSTEFSKLASLNGINWISGGSGYGCVLYDMANKVFCANADTSIDISFGDYGIKSVRYFYEFDNDLYFTAWTAAFGNEELWKIDFNNGTVSVNEVPDKNLIQLNAFPNPSSGQFYIEIPNLRTDIYRAIVYNLEGKQISHRSILNGDLLKIEMRGVPAGIYQVLVESDGMIYSSKIVLQN
jgi:ELWxxDGT repeat protein